MKKVVVERKKLLLDDFFKVEEALVSYELFDGRMSPVVRRLNFERGDAVAVIVFNRESRKVVLTQQFRYPTYEKGDGWLIEIVAGILEKGEEPSETARREVLEEVGYRVHKPVHLFTFYASPGGSSERIFLYYAEVAEADRINGGGGVDTEHEDIRVQEYSLTEIRQLMDSGKIVDAKTIIALMWLKNRLNGETQ